jgi:hypothetical protein
MKRKLLRQAREDRQLQWLLDTPRQQNADLGGIGGPANIHPDFLVSEVFAEPLDRDESAGSL